MWESPHYLLVFWCLWIPSEGAFFSFLTLSNVNFLDVSLSVNIPTQPVPVMG